jgi:outer membrane protein assembly factor BamB
LWSIELGEGYASAAVSRGCAYVLDYDEAAAADTIRCLSLDDGREVWRNSYPAAVTRNHGMSRTVPAIIEGHVITFGPRCHVACWDAVTGDCRPLIDQQRLILAPCGPALLIAVDYHSGELIWQSPNPRGWEMTHASVMPMELGGQRSYVYCGSGGVAAVAADDGRLLWDSTAWPTTFATCPSPLVLPDGRIFLCSGYGRTVGSLMLQVRASGDRLSTETLFELTPAQFNAEHHTPIFFEGHLYGVRKRGGGQMVCLDPDGKELWNSGTDRFGHGPYLVADGLIVVMDDQGWLTIASATPAGYQRLARHEIFPNGHDAWGPMALVEGRLIVRDMTRMTCLDLARR